MKPRILVTGTSTFFATRLIHELGRRGAEITAADSLPLSPGKASKYTSRRLRLPRLTTDPGAYLAAIRHELLTHDYDLLLPTFEEGLLLAEYQDELRELTNVFLPPFETMMQLHHKPSLHELCQTISIPSPATVVAGSMDELDDAAEQVGYPLVLKIPTGNNSVGRTYCDDRESLHSNFARLKQLLEEQGGEPPFLQQKIDGELIYTLCFCDEGHKVGEVIYRTRQTFPHRGGTAAHRESIAHPEIARLTSKLCAETRWTGFLGLDFIVDDKTGIPYLIDANVRANPAMHLGFLAGIDWTQFLFDKLAGNRVRPMNATPGINSHTQLLYGACLFEALGTRAKSPVAWLRRLRDLAIPEWRIDSHDDLLGVGEFASFAVLLGHGLYCMLDSMVTGRQVGQVLLDNANYDSATATTFRNKLAIPVTLHTRPAAQKLRRAA
jgi:predicted ATP-grasp superfamily ATP-dependent carboligase